MYDRPWLPFRRLRALRSAALEVRRAAQRQGCNQSNLRRNCDALDVVGVIYVLWSPFSRKHYVGQTSSSTMKRFQQHYWKACRQGAITPVARWIRRLGMNVYMMPLEMISRDFLKVAHKTTRLNLFRKLASIRERYWIERLHSYVPNPKGLNVACCPRARYRRYRRRSGRRRPGKWRSRIWRGRIQNKRWFKRIWIQTHRPLALGWSRRQRWFAFRGSLRRLLFLTRISPERLNTVDWMRYRRDVLWKMLCVLESDIVALDPTAILNVLKCIRGFLFSRPPQR